MQHQDLRTIEQTFDDLLAEGFSLDDISHRLGWSHWRTRTHYRQVCAAMGEEPDEE